jgi:hypothetical protein
MEVVISSGVHWSTSVFLKKHKRVKRKGAPRWLDEDGRFYYEWDSLHGEIEVFSKRGEHLAVLSADGIYLKGAIKGRTIHV